MTPAALMPFVFTVLYVAHMVADHWLQNDWMSSRKGEPGWSGRAVCALHVAIYTAASVALLLGAAAYLHVDLDGRAVAAGLAVSAGTHYFADRREPLRRLAALTGREGFYRFGAPKRGHGPCMGTGAYVLDQSFHIFWLLIAAVIIAGR